MSVFYFIFDVITHYCVNALRVSRRDDVPSTEKECANFYCLRLFSTQHQALHQRHPILFVTTHERSTKFAPLCIQKHGKFCKKLQLQQNILNCIQTSIEQCASTRLGIKKIALTKMKTQVCQHYWSRA